MKTLIIGSFGNQNIGDQLILKSALQRYQNAVVMTPNPEPEQHFLLEDFETLTPPPLGLRSLLTFLTSKKYRNTLNNSKNEPIETIVFAGGGLLAIKWQAYWHWAVYLWWLKHWYPKATIIAEGQSVDVSNNFLIKKITQYFYRSMQTVRLRDKASYQYLKKLKISAFLDEDVVEKLVPHPLVDQPIINTPYQLVQINNPVSDSALKQLKKLSNPIAVAFHPSETKWHKKYGLKTIEINHYPEVYSLIKQAQLLCGQRFHALLLAGIMNTKVIILNKPYAQKVEPLVSRFGLDIWS